MTETSVRPVRVAVEAGIMVITIDRPEAKNAVNLAVAREIAAALDELDQRADVSVAVITGAGGVFSSGMDLRGFVDGELPIIPGRGFAGIVERPPAKPIIAAVEGYALAGGFEIVLACDLVVAGQEARFGIPEAKRGLIAAGGGLFRLPDRLPINVAMELALTGRFLDAGRARDLGLVNELVGDGRVLEAALDLAREIAANGPLALQAGKQVMRDSRDWTEQERWTRQQDVVDRVFASDDAREGATAFAEKRPPRWVGR